VGLRKIRDAFIEINVPLLDSSNQLLMVKNSIWWAIDHTSSALQTEIVHTVVHRLIAGERQIGENRG
jgi:hypothetical protein